MTQLRTIDAQALAQLNRALVGFDRVFNDRFFTQRDNYPPHNVIKYNDDTYAIEVAVAGFAKEEVSVEVDQDQLIVRGVQDRPNTGNVEYIHRGLAARDFELVFRLENFLEVEGAKVDNGMLQIDIKRIVPEALKPRQIEIK